jgi:hypothetical protein
LADDLERIVQLHDASNIAASQSQIFARASKAMARTALEICLILSDPVYVEQVACEISLDPLSYANAAMVLQDGEALTALCALHSDSVPSAYAEHCNSQIGANKYPNLLWLADIARQMLHALCVPESDAGTSESGDLPDAVTRFVGVMTKLAQSTPGRLGYGGGSTEGDGEVIVLMKFVAAHLSLICIPFNAVTNDAADLRNLCVQQYLDLINGPSGRSWAVGLVYFASIPLMDPAWLHHLVMVAADIASRWRCERQRLLDFLDSHFVSNDGVFRRAVVPILASNDIAREWMQCVARTVQESRDEAVNLWARRLFDGQDEAEALELSLAETTVPMWALFEDLLDRVKSEEALTDGRLWRCGSAIRKGCVPSMTKLLVPQESVKTAAKDPNPKCASLDPVLVRRSAIALKACCWLYDLRNTDAAAPDCWRDAQLVSSASKLLSDVDILSSIHHKTALMIIAVGLTGLKRTPAMPLAAERLTAITDSLLTVGLMGGPGRTPLATSQTGDESAPIECTVLFKELQWLTVELHRSIRAF